MARTHQRFLDPFGAALFFRGDGLAPEPDDAPLADAGAGFEAVRRVGVGSAAAPGRERGLGAGADAALAGGTVGRSGMRLGAERTSGTGSGCRTGVRGGSSR